MNPVLLVRDIAGGQMIWMWCPGCDHQHAIGLGADAWQWDGNMEQPTIQPSILVHPHATFIDPDLTGEALISDANRTTTPLCHSFIVAGQWQFLGDCTHHLAGQTVPMVPLPDWLCQSERTK